MKTKWALGLGVALALASACGDDSGDKDTTDGAVKNDAGLGGNPDGATNNLDSSIPDGSTIAADGAIIPPPGPSSSTKLTLAGGTATSSDGKLTLTFPPNFFVRPTTVLISTPATPPAGAAGTVYDLAPTTENIQNGQQFRVALKYTDADLNGAQPSQLQLGQYLYGRWQVLVGQVNYATKEITGQAVKLGPLAFIGGICGSCYDNDPNTPDKPSGACTPDNCIVRGTTSTKGECVSFGMGCSRCLPTCDTDHDGYCVSNIAPSGDVAGDCLEGNPNVHVGAPELCNGIDDNCNGTTDEGCTACTSDNDCSVVGQFCNSQTKVCEICGGGCPNANAACDLGNNTTGLCLPYGKSCTKCVAANDTDGDGEATGPTGDCDDHNAAVHHGATEVCGNKIDDDCNGQIDEFCACTADSACSTGFTCRDGACQLCNTTCTGCTGTCTKYANDCSLCVPACDTDMDGYCASAGDCAPNDPAIHPGAAELCGDKVDNDCNGHIDEGCNPCSGDADCKDGNEYCNANGACDQCPTDCTGATCAKNSNDGTMVGDVPATTPGTCVHFGTGCSQCRVACDTDGDGFCATPVPHFTNPAPDGYSAVDCDPADPNVYPGAPERCNMKDDNCNNVVDENCTLCTSSAMCIAANECSNLK